jgi:carbon-monoxide dehydrogenase medium subunit
MDIAVAGCGASVTLAEDMETIQAVQLALATVYPTALLVEQAGEELKGKRVSKELLEKAAQLAQAVAKPRTTLRGTASQRRHLVGVLTRRSLWGAIQRARGEIDG